jgi:putative PEP-CTERM system histidine kinase
MVHFHVIATIAATAAALSAAGFSLWQTVHGWRDRRHTGGKHSVSGEPRYDFLKFPSTLQSPRTARLFALGMAAVAVVELASFLAALTTSPQMELFWLRTALFAEGFWPVCWLLFSLTYARAETPGRSARKLLMAASMALIPLLIVLPNWSTFLTLPLDSYEPGRYLALGPWGRLLVGLMMVGMVLPLINLEATLRASAGLGRWHVKFMILGLGLLLGFQIYLDSYRLLFSTLDLRMAGPQAVVVMLSTGMMIVSIARSGQRALGLSVSQSAAFGSIVLLLIGAYLIAAGFLSQFWVSMGGDTADLWQGLLLLVSFIGLAGLLLSSWLKARAKTLLSRHLFTHRYDYRLEWLQLTERMNRQFGLDASLRAVVERLSELLGAPRVSAWLYDEADHHLRLAVTTQLTHAAETALGAQPIFAPGLAGAIAAWDGPHPLNPPPADLAPAAAGEAAALAERTQAQVAAPLVLGGRALGLLALGPRIAGQPYEQEELLFIGAVAQQCAASVLTMRLTQEIIRARETELSQLYSTFLMHDLKNLGTTLSLVAQNLPIRHADAQFRADAGRVIQETIDKIREMTEKVATLRHHYELSLESTDLNSLAEESIRALNGTPRTPSDAIPLTVDFKPEQLPLLRLDRREFRSVLTNLLLNAREAMRHTGGRIRLETRHQGDWASLSVIDEGCGMSPDFLDRHLFQPFHSTKPGGLGIGLYQCRKIVNAHGGQIMVDSLEGKGTTVTVLLPAHTG